MGGATVYGAPKNPILQERMVLGRHSYSVDLQVDFFDATGTLFAMANFMNNFLPGGSLSILDLSGALFD